MLFSLENGSGGRVSTHGSGILGVENGTETISFFGDGFGYWGDLCVVLVLDFRRMVRGRSNGTFFRPDVSLG